MVLPVGDYSGDIFICLFASVFCAFLTIIVVWYLIFLIFWWLHSWWHELFSIGKVCTDQVYMGCDSSTCQTDCIEGSMNDQWCQNGRLCYEEHLWKSAGFFPWCCREAVQEAENDKSDGRQAFGLMPLFSPPLPSFPVRPEGLAIFSAFWRCYGSKTYLFDFDSGMCGVFDLFW